MGKGTAAWYAVAGCRVLSTMTATKGSVDSDSSMGRPEGNEKGKPIGRQLIRGMHGKLQRFVNGEGKMGGKSTRKALVLEQKDAVASLARLQELGELSC